MVDGRVGSYFEALGDEVVARWKAGGSTDAALVDAAEAAMRVVDVPAGIDATTVLDYLVGGGDLPPQNKSDPFGQPPVVAYAHEEIFVQVLFWMDGTTAIHDHGFAGAFGVLQGSSLHVAYDFDVAERLDDDRVRVGDLRPLHAEVLLPGSVRRIEPGSDFIHALFHLEMPTVSVVVRNRRSKRDQFDYRFPGLAYDGWWSDDTWDKRVQGLFALDRFAPDRAAASAIELVRRLPLREAWVVLDRWVLTHGRQSSTFDLLEAMSRRVPTLAPLIESAVEHAVAQQHILRRRSMLREFHQRAFLALMANLTTSHFTLDLVGQLVPDQDPAATLFDWAAELSGPSLRSVSGLMLEPGKLAELREAPVDRGVPELLAVVRSLWDDPLRRVRDVLAPS